MTASAARAFRWLQISGLQISRSSEARRTRKLSDLAADANDLLGEIGELHAILVTGDIGSTGSAADYEAAASSLASFRSLLQGGESAPVISVPGNHDVDRRSVENWLDEVRRTGFSDSDLEVEIASAAFQNYLAGQEKPRRGALPGDAAIRLEGDALSVGIVGLNTAVPLSGKADATALGSLFPGQLRRLLGQKVDRWTSATDIALLMTHHGPASLNDAARSVLFEEVFTPGRFAVHLFEAPHESSSLTFDGWGVTASVGSLAGRLASYAICTVSLQEHGGGLLEVERRIWRDEEDSFVGVDESRFEFAWSTDPSSAAGKAKSSKDSTTVPDQPALSDELSRPAPAPNRIGMIEIANYRGLSHVAFSLAGPSLLGGSWTCIAGTNGVGKSSVLEAIALALIGEPAIQELGGERLRSMRRRIGGKSADAAVALLLEAPHLYLQVRIHGSKRGTSGVPPTMLDAWSELRSVLVCGYGATRNLGLSGEVSSRYLSHELQSVMSLFQPLTELDAAQRFLDPHYKTPRRDQEFIVKLLNAVFDGVFQTQISRGQVQFCVRGSEVPARDLPDGFRSSAAWLIDLGSRWISRRSRKVSAPKDIEAIVLIDEIDLHLHPSLEREIVPRLREALPKVCWVTTTHSPLVLASFDQHEIVVLDPDAPFGVRRPDRQIMTFSPDDIYELLLETPASSGASERLLEQASDLDERGLAELAAMLRTSQKTSPSDARAQTQHYERLVSDALARRRKR